MLSREFSSLGTKQQLLSTCSVIVKHRGDIDMELKGGQIEQFCGYIMETHPS